MKLLKVLLLIFFHSLTLSIFSQQKNEIVQNIECFKKVISVGFDNLSWNIDSINHLKASDSFLANNKFKVINDTLIIKSINDTTLWQKIILQSDTVALIIVNFRELTGKSKRHIKKLDKLSNGSNSNLIYLRYSKDGKLQFYKNALDS